MRSTVNELRRQLHDFWVTLYESFSWVSKSTKHAQNILRSRGMKCMKCFMDPYKVLTHVLWIFDAEKTHEISIDQMYVDISC